VAAAPAAGNRVAGTFGGFIWDEGDEMKKNRNTWGEVRGEEEITLPARSQMFC